MSWFSVDIEADGPIPGDYSMTEIGAVLILRDDLTHTFHGKLRPNQPLSMSHVGMKEKKDLLNLLTQRVSQRLLNLLNQGGTK